MTTTATEAKTTTKPRQSRTSRAAAEASKPKATEVKAGTTKAKSTTKPAPKPAPEPKAPTATELKQRTSQWAVDLLAGALVKSPPAGISADQAAAWLNAWCSYFPGARQHKLAWPTIFGEVSMAGAPKK